MSFYALGFGADGAAWPVHYDQPPEAMPDNQIACSKDQFESPTNWAVSNGAIIPASSAAVLSSAKMAAIRVVNERCEGDLRVITAPYTSSEVSTWPQQVLEAMAYTASASAPTPMLTAIATGSGKTVAALAASIVAAASAYQAASGAAVGRRQLLTAQINAASTVAAVQAINW